jgi:hypothetical protein
VSTADIAVAVNGIVDLAAIGAAWSLVKSGRVRLSSPTPAQLQAEREQPQVTAEPAADRPVLEVAS